MTAKMLEREFVKVGCVILPERDAGIFTHSDVYLNKIRVLLYWSHMSTADLHREIEMLRSFAVSIVGKDSEGEYRPDFVRKVLRSVHLRPTRRFENAKAFLAEVEASSNA